MRAYVPVIVVDRDRPSDRALGILKECVNAHIVVSLIHPDDIQASLALRVLRFSGANVMSVNHADHGFSFGLGAANVVLEVSGFGWRLSEATRPIRAHSFLGIPVNVDQASSGPAVDGALLVSMGPTEKYAPQIGRPDFQEFLLRVLEETSCRVELIGPTGEESWWQQAVRRFPGRITFTGPLPYLDAREKVSRAACYVDSFPMNGGTAFVEALAMGKPVFGVGENSGYNLAQMLYSKTVDDLLGTVARFIEGSEEVPLQGQLRRRVRAEFSPSSVCDRLVAAAKGEFFEPPEELSGHSFPIDYYVQNWINQNRLRILFDWPHALPRRARILIALTIARDIATSDKPWDLLSRLPRIVLFILKTGRYGSLELD